MANNTTSTSGLTDHFQPVINKKLLDYAVQALKLDQFADKATLPKNAGSKVIRFFQYGEPSAANVLAMTEGDASAGPAAAANYRVLEMTTVDATLTQLGEVIGVTDLMSATDLLGTMKQATVTAGQDAALKADTLIRDELVTSTSGESDSRTKRYSGSANTTWAELAADSAVTANFTAVDLLDGCTNLKINRAPQIDGGYVAVVPPEVSRDLMNDDDWLEAHKYSDVKPLYKGEAGSLHGVRIVEATNSHREAGASGAKGTFAAAGNIFSTIITGANSYGVPALAGDSPMSPKIVVADTPDKSDPLNQLTTIGFKLFYVAKALNTNWFIIHRSKSAYA